MLFEELSLAADRAPVSRGDNHQLGRSGERRALPCMRQATQGKQKKDTEDRHPLYTRGHGSPSRIKTQKQRRSPGGQCLQAFPSWPDGMDRLAKHFFCLGKSQSSAGWAWLGAIS